MLMSTSLDCLFLHCWDTNDKHGGRRGLTFGAGWQQLLTAFTAPVLIPSCGALSKWQRWVTLSHPSVLLSVIGTNLVNVKGCSLISCGVVVTSSWYCWNARHSNRVCPVYHHLAFFYRSWHIWGFPLTSCVRSTSSGLRKIHQSIASLQLCLEVVY